jgi:hypothetical protein
VGRWAVSVHENDTSVGVDTALEEGHVALEWALVILDPR